MHNNLNNLDEILFDNIPKKIKKPEFQVNKSKIDAPVIESNFSYSSTQQSAKNFPTFIPDDPKSILALVSFLRKESKLDSRLNLSNNFEKINSTLCLNRFMQLNGNQILGDWIDDYKEDFESNLKIDPKVFEILTNILNFCDKLPVSVQELKVSKIGKKINKLGKCVSDRVLKNKCEELVLRWKKLADGDKKRSKEDKAVNSSSKRREKSNSPKRHYDDDKMTMKKTKREDFSRNENSNGNSHDTSTLGSLLVGQDKNNKKYIIIPHNLFIHMFIKKHIIHIIHLFSLLILILSMINSLFKKIIFKL
jgi:hypothetical protein